MSTKTSVDHLSRGVVVLVVGVSVPLVVACLIYRTSERSEPGPAALFEEMEEEGLLDDRKHDNDALEAHPRENRRPRSSLPENKARS